MKPSLQILNPFLKKSVDSHFSQIIDILTAFVKEVVPSHGFSYLSSQCRYELAVSGYEQLTHLGIRFRESRTQKILCR